MLIHDLACGTGSMLRWLAPRLPGPQHWVCHDLDPELLAFAAGDHAPRARDGSPVTVEVREADVTRLAAGELDGAALVTASALLDLLTSAELDRVVASCVAARCPALFTLSVTGRVKLSPSHPLDAAVGAAFDAHQRRVTDGRRLLGPDAPEAAARAFAGAGYTVRSRPSAWRLGAAARELTAEWFTGWLGAAGEQQPELAADTADYAAQRFAEAAAGRLSVLVEHQDVLAWPAGHGHARAERVTGPLRITEESSTRGLEEVSGR